MKRFLLCVLFLLTSAWGPAAHAQQGTVQGRVADAETGEPVPRANLVWERNGTTAGTSTDTTGAFEIRLAPGQYQFRASALSYQTRERTVEVRAGETTSLRLTLFSQSYSLNEIVVLDERGGTTRSVSTVQRIEPQAIERQDAADVSELAPLVPATHVQTNSRGQTILYFRNAGDRQVGQFFDGALLNIPWDNRVDISLIPASVVEGITVTKGVPSVRYGANVLGGAVNFQSRTLDAPGRQTELKAALGTAEQRRATVTHLGRTDRWDYTAAVQYTERGDQPLPDGANLEFNQPRADRRVNTDRQLVSGFGRASYRFDGGGQMGVSLLHVDAEQGVAPEGNATKPQTRYWRYPLWQKTTLITSGRGSVGTNTSIRGAAWGSRFAQDIADYRSVAYDTLNQVQQGRDLTGGLRLIGSQNLPVGTLTLALNGLTSRHEKGTVFSGQTDAEPDSTTTFQQHIFSAGLEYEAQVHSRMEVSAGANLDGADYPQTGPFPERDPFYAWGLTSGLRVDVADGWALRGAAGRKSRFPTMRELYGAAIGKFVPNPNLKPVTAWIGEVGFEHRSPSFFVGSAAFLNRVRNTIDKRTIQEGPNAGKEQRINLEGARIYGVETRVRWTPTEPLVLDGNVTWSHSRGFTDDGETQKLDEKPGLLGTGTISYDFPVGLSVMGQARYTGNVYARNEQNEFVTLPSSPSTVLDARLSYELSSVTDLVDGRVYLRGENLTDEVVFIGLGLPRAGRSFRVGLDLTL
jgi:iron complex outermembrane receptor protein